MHDAITHRCNVTECHTFEPFFATDQEKARRIVGAGMRQVHEEVKRACRRVTYAVDRSDATTSADADNPTTKIATSRRRFCTLVYGCWKICPNRATFGHFSGRTGRLASGNGHSVSGYSINRSNRASRQPGRLKNRVAWRTPKRPLFWPPAVQYLKNIWTAEEPARVDLLPQTDPKADDCTTNVERVRISGSRLSTDRPS
jgi:hypothetical protein